MDRDRNSRRLAVASLRRSPLRARVHGAHGGLTRSKRARPPTGGETTGPSGGTQRDLTRRHDNPHGLHEGEAKGKARVHNHGTASAPTDDAHDEAPTTQAGGRPRRTQGNGRASSRSHRPHLARHSVRRKSRQPRLDSHMDPLIALPRRRLTHNPSRHQSPVRIQVGHARRVDRNNPLARVVPPQQHP